MSDTQALTFDMTALTESVDPAAERAEAARLLNAEVGDRTAGRFAFGVWFRGVGTVVGLALVGALVILIPVMALRAFTGRVPAPPVIIAGWLILIAPDAYTRIRRIAPGLRDASDRWYRLARFAPANALSHELTVDVGGGQEPPAAAFSVGSGTKLNDRLAGAAPRPFEVANLSYYTGGGRTRVDTSFGYVHFRLSAVVPEMSLIAVDGRGAPAWRPPSGQKQIMVDDEFDRQFRVFCAPEDEAAARGWLGSSLRSALADAAGGVDVQLVGDDACFFVRHDLRLQNPTVWEWIEDLSGMLDAHLDPRPNVPTPMPTPVQDEARRARRVRMLRRGEPGYPFLLGCLIPVIVSVSLLTIGAIMR
ncbi:hypothetical protein [Psychromicrobium xiongbiense]|uniref:hypothetical protein n=1 Tax=Psychromicrobium xiongbiense TaxID=3051184 RepID=UPI00255304CB|nr:hypothetical protein [Psychromicrobium sp. YIM S02556]